MTSPPLVFADPPILDPLRRRIAEMWRADETARGEALMAELDAAPEVRARIEARAVALVEEVRRRSAAVGGLDAFLHEYDLSNREGVALMCLAEALLRIPDAGTADLLIADKLLDGDWQRHLGHSGSPFVNASTWALMLTGRLLRPDEERDLGAVLRGLAARGGRPVVRRAVLQAMRIMGGQFVMGRTIAEALKSAGEAERAGYRFSYDMLGEGARTAHDAERYAAAYAGAIDAIGRAARGGDVFARPGISVKLSALHPRYRYAQRDRVMAELAPRLRDLARAARGHGIGLTVDAEEADRLDLSLDVFASLCGDPTLAGWDGFGLALQAYQKRAPFVLDWLVDLAAQSRRRIPVRLVKGAYWDAEIKRSQVAGHDGYPVFTRKQATDVSWLCCARRMLELRDRLYPQFATHNAHSVAAVLDHAGDDRRGFEFQRLYGMGEALHDQLVAPEGQGGFGVPSRIYAPVGGHEELLAYLVRRLLENGANTSFVNRIVHEDLAPRELAADPAERLRALHPRPHPRIPLPADIYGPGRRNAAGLELADPLTLETLKAALERAAAVPRTAAALVGGREAGQAPRPVLDPADRGRTVGTVRAAGEAEVERALSLAAGAAPDWDRMPAEGRADILGRAADLFEAERADLMFLAIREAGKTIPAALAEVREAVDFLRYYAVRCAGDFGARPLPGPTGEENRLQLHGRGVFACISPWNFPLAIFTGQVAAALAAGNAVVAKPAGQTPLIAAVAVRLLHRAGVPENVLHLLPGGGEVGGLLVADLRVAGVAFTGSTDTARGIGRVLAARAGPIVPLIAETGGQNAMIVDSSALPEQVVDDVILSAFDSAGQRCSAARVLFVQEDVAPQILAMLTGAISELRIGDPGLLSTDVGPVIDAEALARLRDHVGHMKRTAKMLAGRDLDPEAARGTFLAPHVFEIDDIGLLEREVFGPVLHVVRWRAGHLDRVVDAINATGYGLTLGIHSRVEATVRRIAARARVGNLYVNRNMIGAVVGVQPFGGEGLSGTGPKAGGPHYLPRFATERVVSVDTTAAGGNASLIGLSDV
ncbi:RHH-type proline utilization regulon transcriptional repressor/proline dehydrogenase/delta 1-pyrroline-5-carboxylate dehydrogenase [Constrictibacter sp. MBR-5]|jgi:RHH-type proline utilization regulon transcriptional repressor/proline dehydrogenase/delta 1-pyrroline-5-carboxylate dehydrogenase|uniref:bifunctional proline dehydrogenase/L-glutamate gamma-semialdehyde dehydrogenase PutA n=1 Tax=Constrictibacter sp. MBR-5 TaxID=3156467 RepID=UPI0033974555